MLSTPLSCQTNRPIHCRSPPAVCSTGARGSVTPSMAAAAPSAVDTSLTASDSSALDDACSSGPGSRPAQSDSARCCNPCSSAVRGAQ
jgi:hypothetical protein